MPELFTRAYFDELANLLNADPDFQSKTANLNTHLLFVAKDKERSFSMKIEKGKVSISDANRETSADFTFIGDYATWITNHKDGIPIEKLIMTGKLKFKGSIPRILSMKSSLGAIDSKSRTILAQY